MKPGDSESKKISACRVRKARKGKKSDPANVNVCVNNFLMIVMACE